MSALTVQEVTRIAEGIVPNGGPMRQYLNEEHRKMFDNYFRIALTGGCDARQAESIAKERTLLAIMSASAAIASLRSQIAGNVSRELPAPRYRG